MVRMNTQEAARQYKANMDATRNGTITADEFRARNRKLRERVGAAVHTQAKMLAVAAANR